MADGACLREADAAAGRAGTRFYWLALNLWRVRPGQIGACCSSIPKSAWPARLPLLLFATRTMRTLPWPALAKIAGRVSQIAWESTRTRCSQTG